ncbi:glycosyl hydrolase family 18 protein [Enterobacter bugandensis]|uniref:glycoside hydrolase family 18 protein n=1 Tax=Enterobacter bugandensis TaxID=881260 RepID=UPI003D6F267C
MRKLSIIALATLSAIYGTHAFAVEVTPNESGKVVAEQHGSAGEVSRHRGDRLKTKLQWKSWSNDMEGLHPHSPKNYRVYKVDYTNPGDIYPSSGNSDSLILKDSENGFAANLEKNVPFQHNSNKIVGMYYDEWAYWERSFTADLVPANNLTHIFWSFLGLCDFNSARPSNVTLPVTENTGLIAEGNERGQKILKAMCGQGDFPTENGTTAWQGKDTPAKQQGDFNVTRYDPQASYYGLQALEKMKKANPKLNVMVSIGGWSMSSPFHAMVETQEGRTIFVNSVMDFLKENPFVDGIDLDWEFVGSTGPSAIGDLATDGYQQERSRYTKLVKQLRQAMDAKYSGSQRKQLSAAVSASPAKLAAIDFNSLKDDFDFINIMTYDMYGAFARNPGHQAAVYAKPIAGTYYQPGSQNKVKDEAGNIIIDGQGNSMTGEQAQRGFSTEGAVKAILDNNPDFPSEKLVIGAAAYSRGWHSVSVKPEHDKLFWHGIANGETVSRKGLGSNGSYEHGVTDYRELYDTFISKKVNTYYDKQAEAAYIWKPISSVNGNPTAQVETFDSQRSVIAKGDLVKKYKLGGLFAWAASNDNGLILNSMNAAVCNKRSSGDYYNFTEHYNGVVDTKVLQSQNDVPVKVHEILSGAQNYNFDGKEYCSDDIETDAPAVTLDRTSLSVVATTNTGFGYKVSANSSQDDVTWKWELAEGDKNIYLKSYDKPTAEIVVPKQNENHISDMYAKFKVSATKNGKTGHSYVTINVVKPAVSITGDSHMSPANPAKLTARANFDQATYDWTLKRNGQNVSGGIDASGQIAKNLPGGDYTAEVFARSDKGGRKASAEYTIKVEEQAQNNDQAFINALSLSIQSTDNGDSVTFSGSVASSSAATSTPGYAWTLPAGAHGGSNGQPQQRFTVTKNKQVQNLKVKVKVTAGKEMRELERDITVPAQTETGQYPLYKPGTAYKAGEVVKNKNGDLFECKPWPYTGWCGSSSALHYEPGIGLNWKDAWNSK